MRPASPISVALVALFFLAACAPSANLRTPPPRQLIPTEQIHATLQEADKAIAQRDFNHAIEVLRATHSWVLNGEQAGHVALRFARMTASITGQPSQALGIYQRLLERFSNTVAARLALQDVRALTRGPGAKNYWIPFLVLTRDRMRKMCFSHVLEVHLAQAYYEQGEVDLAMDLLRRIHQMGARSSVWHRASDLLARYLHDQGRFQEEKWVLLRMITPGHFGVPAPLSTSALELRLSKMLCSDLSETSEAVVILNRFAARHPHSNLRDDALWELAQCFDTANEAKARSDVLCEILRKHPRTRHARRARQVLNLPVGEGPGGSGADQPTCPNNTPSP